MGRSCLKSLLARVDILILNQEEAAIFTGINYQNEKNNYRNGAFAFRY